MILADVMDEIATQLDTITGLRVYPYPVPKVEAPAAIVGYPEDYAYDMTYGRGSDSMTLSVFVLVPRPLDRATRDALSQYVDGSGAASIKQVAESGSYTAFDSLQVAGVEFDVLTLAGVDYMAATFSFKITGSGAA